MQLIHFKDEEKSVESVLNNVYIRRIEHKHKGELHELPNLQRHVKHNYRSGAYRV